MRNEVIYNKPKSTPYKGKDLLRGELLFGLRGLLIDYAGADDKRKKEFLKDICKKTKEFYLNF